MMWTGLLVVFTYAIIYAFGVVDVDPGDWVWFAAWAVLAICGAIKEARK